MNTYKRLQIPLQPATKTSTNKNIFGSSVLQQTDDTIKVVIQAQNLSHSEMFKAYAIVSHNGQYIGIHLGNLTTRGNTSELKKEYTKTIDNTIYTINDIVAITVELDGKYNNLTLLVGYPKGYVNCINNYSTNVRNMTTLKPTKSTTNNNLTSSSTTTTNNTTTTHSSPIPTLYNAPHHSSHSSTTTYDNNDHNHHHTTHSTTTTYDHHHNNHHHTSHSTTTYDHHHNNHHHTSHSTTTYDHHHNNHHHTSHSTTTTYDHHHDHHTSHTPTTTYDHHHHNNIGNSPTLSNQATKATTNDFYNELLSEPTQETTLETVINKLKEELNSLKELSTATKDDLHKHNKEFIKQSKINTQDNMNFMLKNNEPIKPFTQQNKDIDWVVIHTNELVILHKDYWQLFWDDFVCDCYNSHGHLIFGSYIEDDLQYYILGVPTYYAPQQVRAAQNLGFFQFKPCDNTNPADDVFGYWLLQIKH